MSVPVSNIKYIGIYCLKVNNGMSATGLYYQIVTECVHGIEILYYIIITLYAFVIYLNLEI